MPQILALLVVLLLGSVVPMQAQINCGATITADTVLMPTDPVVSGACATNPALTVVGPAELDMNGLSVSCSSTGRDGIVIRGTKAEVFNGSVSGCRTGFAVDEELGSASRNKLYNLVARDNADNGFEIGGSSSSIVGCVARDNGDRGFSIGSAKGKVVDNSATGNQTGFSLFGSSLKAMRNIAADNSGAGFRIQGDGVKLKDNVASGNVAGFAVEGSDASLKANQASANLGVGFFCDFGSSGHKLKANSASGGSIGFDWAFCHSTDFVKNVASSNEIFGFQVNCDGCKLVGNVAAGSGSGFVVNGSDNKLTKNVASGGQVGLGLESGPTGGNDLKGNRLLGNFAGLVFLPSSGPDNRAASNVSLGNSPGLDLSDASDSACTDMAWEDNLFETSNDACIE